MKTKITSLLVLSAITFTLRAQIPNASFENWTGNEPSNWITYNSIVAGIVTQIADPHAGAKAVKLNVVSFLGNNTGGSLFTGTSATNTYFHVSSPPAAIHGWYKFHSIVSSESFIVTGLVKDLVSPTGSAAGLVSTNTLVYTEFVVNFNYIGTPAADSAYLYITLNDADSVRVGTYAIIDDLAFGPAVGVEELSTANLLEPCNPNPASEVVDIIYRISGQSKVSLALFDVVGNKIVTLLDELDQTTGRYKIPTDVSDLADGIYFYVLNVNDQPFTQKLVVSKAGR
jgi:hypothetical protein